MRKVKRLLGMFLVLGFYLYLPVSVCAHTMWINATDYSPDIYPRFGATTNIYFGWGHRYPVDGFLAKTDLEEFYFVCPRCGKHHPLTPNPGGFLSTEISFKEPGAYIVAAKLKPGFYTMYGDKGRIHHKMGPKTGLKGVILSLYYEQYTKALINTGEKDLINFDKPVGHKLEIVPLKNPGDLRGCGGHFLPIKVLLDGKPAKFCGVRATYSGFSTGEDFAYATSTNGEGIAKIRLIHYGQWLIKADMKLPAGDELKDKCNQLHYTATLTFEVP